MENNQPINPTGISMLAKLLIGFFIWLIFSALVFIVFIWLGWTISQAIRNSTQSIGFSPLVWLSFMWIALIASIWWSLVISIIYNALRPDDYYDIKLMSSGILTTNLLLLVIFLFFYVFVGSVLQDIKLLFIVFGFHLAFSIFISFVIMDSTKNPNYSAVYVIWNAFGFIIALLLFFVIFSLYSWKVWSEAKNILFYPPILSFSIIPFIATLWEKIYYRFYEMWSDFLYIPSISEVLVDEEEVDEVNVDI